MDSHKFVDITSDPNFLYLFQIYKNGLISSEEIQKFSKNATLNKYASHNTGSNNNNLFVKKAYADPALNLFPCFNKEATLSNWHYFLYQSSKMPDTMFTCVLRNFKKFGEMFNINKEMAKVAEHYYNQNLIDDERAEKIGNELNAYLHKYKNLDDFALVYEKHGHVYTLFPIRNDTEIRLALDFIKTKAKSIPFKYRVKMARRIYNKLVKSGSVLFENHKNLLNKLLLNGFTKVADVLHELKRLLDYGLNPRIKVGTGSFTKKNARVLYTWYKALLPLRDKTIKSAALVKIMNLLDIAKREDGLYNLPGESTPEEKLVIVKQANKHIHLKSGHLLDPMKLMEIPKAILKESFGPEIEDFITNSCGSIDLEKLTSWAESLPQPDAKTLVIIIRKHKPSAIINEDEVVSDINKEQLDEMYERAEEELGEDIDEDEEENEKEEHKKKVKVKKKKEKNEDDEQEDEEDEEDEDDDSEED